MIWPGKFQAHPSCSQSAADSLKSIGRMNVTFTSGTGGVPNRLAPPTSSQSKNGAHAPVREGRCTWMGRRFYFPRSRITATHRQKAAIKRQHRAATGGRNVTKLLPVWEESLLWSVLVLSLIQGKLGSDDLCEVVEVKVFHAPPQNIVTTILYFYT